MAPAKSKAKSKASVAAANAKKLKTTTKNVSKKRGRSESPEIQEPSKRKKAGAKSASRSDEPEDEDNASASVPEPSSTNKAGPRADPLAAPDFSGDFDIYQMALDDELHESYLPEGSQSPHFEDVYNAIQITEVPYAAQIHLNPGGALIGEDDDELGDDDSTEGAMMGQAIKDPIVEMPYNLTLTSVDTEADVTWTEDELMQFPERDSDPSGPGVKAQVELAGGGHHDVVSHFGDGYLKLVRVWSKVGASGELQELFEGYFEFEVGYVLKFAKKYGHKDSVGFTFWATRSRIDNNGKVKGLARTKRRMRYGFCGSYESE